VNTINRNRNIKDLAHFIKEAKADVKAKVEDTIQMYKHGNMNSKLTVENILLN
jgi:hypothetical protein